MSDFTKGPWSIDEYGTVVTAGNRILVVEGVALSGSSTKEVRANTTLIGASPELLQALQLVAAHIPEIIAAGILSAAETDTIRASITKAGD